MTQQLRVAGALGAAIAALMALALPVAILLLLDPASSSACGGTPTGPGPSSVPGVPQRFLPIYEGAAQQFGLGSDGWAYLAALNYAESSFGTDNGPGTGVLSGSNYAGAAGPMQIGIGGAATDNWSTVIGQIPPNLPGGAQPPSVYNETDAVYGAAILLKRLGAPGDWHARARRLEQLPARDRPSHPARRAVHQHRPGAGRRARRVGDAGVRGRAGMRAGERPHHPRRRRKDPAQRTRGDPAERPAGRARNDRRRQPDHPLPLQLGRRARAGVDESAARPERRPGTARRTAARAMTAPRASASCSGAQASDRACSAGQVPTSWTLENVGLQGAGQWVTIYAGTSGGQGHTFIEVAGIVLDTVHGSATTPGGTGPRWQPASEVSYETNSGSFVTRHPQGL